MLKNLLLATAVLAPMPAFAAVGDWTLTETTNPFGTPVKVYTSYLQSPTTETDSLTVSSKGCITVDHKSSDVSRTLTVKSSPTLTDGISVTAVAGVTPTAGVGTHTTVAGQVRRVWLTAAYAAAAAGNTSVTVTDVQGCSR